MFLPVPTRARLPRVAWLVRQLEDNMKQTLHAVTGAFGYSGKYIAKRLLDRGHEVITLTNSHDRENPFAGRV